MPWIRRRRRSDDELPTLPEPDGDEGEGVSGEPLELPEFRDDLGVDDEAPLEVSEAPRDDLPGDTRGDAEGPLDGGGEEEVSVDRETSWIDVGDAEPPRSDDALPDESTTPAGDAGDDGPLDDQNAAMGELPPLDGAEDVRDEAVEADAVLADADGRAPFAFTLTLDDTVTARTLSDAGGRALRFSAVCREGSDVVAVADGVHRYALGPSSDGAVRPRKTEPLPRGETVSAVMSLEGVTWAATSEGNILRASRRETWRSVRKLSAGVSALWNDGEQVWALDGGGALFSVGDPSRAVHFPGVVTAVCTDPRGGMTLATAGADGDNLHHCLNGVWTSRATPDRCVASSLAMAGEHRALASTDPKAPLWLSRDEGSTWTPEPSLAGSTAISIAETDDGALGLVAAIHDAARGRSTLVTALLSARGPLQLFRFFDVPTDDEGDEDSARVELLRSIDRPARTLLVVTADGRAFRVDRG